MKICRFDDNRVGLVQGDQVHDVTSVLSELGSFTYPLPRQDPFMAALAGLKPKLEFARSAAMLFIVTPPRALEPVWGLRGPWAQTPGKSNNRSMSSAQHIQTFV